MNRKTTSNGKVSSKRSRDSEVNGAPQNRPSEKLRKCQSVPFTVPCGWCHDEVTAYQGFNHFVTCHFNVFKEACNPHSTKPVYSTLLNLVIVLLCFPNRAKLCAAFDVFLAIQDKEGSVFQDMKTGFNELIKDSIGETGLLEKLVYMENTIKMNEELMKDEWNCSLLLWNNRVHGKSPTAKKPGDYIFEPQSSSISWFKKRIDRCVKVAKERVPFEKTLLNAESTANCCNESDKGWNLACSIISLQTSMFSRAMFDSASHLAEVQFAMKSRNMTNDENDDSEDLEFSSIPQNFVDFMNRSL
ncbi:unnamed protein product [Ambrosiozyma monospora]|uniref:Unnamed protein product n=1 Tax=Ambrosiozyma monospora TaxID=43982 RepID=A0A9W6YYU4_AMBMO|nr:unnamed protein product [Ambrosiozyma monospora]